MYVSLRRQYDSNSFYKTNKTPSKNSSRLVGQQRGIGGSRRKFTSHIRKVPSHKHLVWAVIMTAKKSWNTCFVLVSQCCTQVHNPHYHKICVVMSWYILPHFLPSVTLWLGPVSFPVQPPSHWAMFRILFKHCFEELVAGKEERLCFGYVAFCLTIQPWL